jgi:hypothetical protein
MSGVNEFVTELPTEGCHWRGCVLEGDGSTDSYDRLVNISLSLIGPKPNL